MSLERRALQVQLGAFPGTGLHPEVARLLDQGLGGLCLFGSNTRSGSEALVELTTQVHAAAPDAVVAVDEEGGDVTRLHADTGSPVLGAAGLGAANDLALTRATGRAVGAELARHGIDLDLGPVADVNSNPANPVIGVRSFGADPDLAAVHVAEWVTGLQESGVAACVKHFPGHGDTAEDSHLALPVLDADLPALLARELVPFAAAARADAAAVMTSHLLVTSLDRDLPATLSRKVLGLLRDRLAYDGLVVSDALDMAGASDGRGVPAAAVLALDAGCDLLCLGADKDVDLVRAVQAAVVEAVREGRLAEERLDEAARRVERIASRPRPDLPDEPLDHAAQLRGARAALHVDGVLPSLVGALSVRLETTPNIAVGVVPWGLPADLVLELVGPDPAGRLREALVDGSVPGDRPLVLQARDADRRPEARDLIAEIATWGTPAVVVEWGWPGGSAHALPRVCAYGASLPATAAVAELLRQTGWER